MTSSLFAPVAAHRKARLARRDRARSLEDLAAWAKLVVGFVMALAILMPAAIMVGYEISWQWFV